MLDRLAAMRLPLSAAAAVALCSNACRCSRSSSTTTPTSSSRRRSNGSGSSPRPLRGQAGPPRQRDRLRRRRRRAARHPRARCCADLGIDAEWQVMHGSDEFFAVTKKVHNALQGADIEWTAAMQRIYLETVLDNSLLLDRRLGLRRHPRPAAGRAARLPPRRPEPRRPTTRSGSGAATSTSPRRTRRSGSSSARSSSSTTRRCGRCRSSCPHRCTMDRVVHAPPCIDPLSVKNLELPVPFCVEIAKQYGIDPNRSDRRARSAATTRGRTRSASSRRSASSGSR